VEFLKREDGPTAVEYAVMLALIIIVCITAIATIGSNANGTFGLVATKVSGASSLPPATTMSNPDAERVAKQFLDDLGVGNLVLARERMTAAGKAVAQWSLQAGLDK